MGIVPYAVTIEEERPLEVPQVLTVEITTQRPNPQYQQIPKEIARVQIQVTEQIVEVPTIVQEEQPVEVPEARPMEAQPMEARQLGVAKQSWAVNSLWVANNMPHR